MKGRFPTYIQGHKTRPLVLRMLDSADKNIFMISPWINQSTVVDTLCEKASIGLNVWILTKPIKFGSRYEKSFRLFNTSKVKLAVDEKEHSKMLIVDNRMVLLSSANFTNRGLSNYGEAGILLSDPNNVTDCLRDFLVKFYRARDTMYIEYRNTT